jgi:hypothetical protein
MKKSVLILAAVPVIGGLGGFGAGQVLKGGVATAAPSHHAAEPLSPAEGVLHDLAGEEQLHAPEVSQNERHGALDPDDGHGARFYPAAMTHEDTAPDHAQAHAAPQSGMHRIDPALIEAYRTDLAMTKAQDEARRKLDEKIAAMDAKGEQTTAHPSLLPVETEAAIAADAIKRIEASPDHVVKLGRMTVPVYKASKVTYFVADFGVSVTDLDQASHYYDGQNAARLRDQIIATMHVAAENQLMRGDDVDSEKLAARVAEDLRAKFAGVEDFLFLSLYKTDVPRG